MLPNYRHRTQDSANVPENVGQNVNLNSANWSFLKLNWRKLLKLNTIYIRPIYAWCTDLHISANLARRPQSALSLRQVLRASCCGYCLSGATSSRGARRGRWMRRRRGAEGVGEALERILHLWLRQRSSGGGSVRLKRVPLNSDSLWIQITTSPSEWPSPAQCSDTNTTLGHFHTSYQ